MKKLNLAIIGQGRSGKNIHGVFYVSENNKYFNVLYVVDADENRRAKAKEMYPGCVTFADYKSLFDKNDIDLVVNASFSQMHYSITKDLLMHKKNVLTEKPLAATKAECEDLIKTAEENGVHLIPFQQSFFAPYYINAKKIIEKGILGEILQVNISYNGFARRWDWQTLQKNVAGGLYNTGPHPVGLALGFLDFDKDMKVVYSKLGSALTSGDSDDYAKVLITAPNKPLVDVEVCSNDAYSQWKLKVLGTKGTLYSNLSEYKLTYLVDGENPERPVIETFLQDENGEPMYCRENLIKHQEEGRFDGNAVFDEATATVYEEIYHLICENKPITITAKMASDIISVIETVHNQNPMPKRF